MKRWTMTIALALTSFGARAEDKGYVIEQKVPTDIVVGKPAAATLAIVAKPPYHMNREFPTRLRLAAPSEVKLPKTEHKIADAKSWSDSRGEFEVPFTIDKPGTYELALDLRSAVCTKETCVPFKEKLVWKVTGK